MNKIDISVSHEIKIAVDLQGETAVWINERNIAKEVDKRIISLSVAQNAVVVVIDDLDLHQKSVADSYCENKIGNILAFNLQGKKLWRIDDLVDSLHFPFSGGHLATIQNRNFYSKWYGIHFDVDHEYYIGVNCADEHYLIDLTDGVYVSKMAFRS